MVNQRESIHFTPSTLLWLRKNYLALFFAYSLLISLTSQESNAQTTRRLPWKDVPKTETLTHLDSLIAWPYTPEAKKNLLTQKLPEITRKNCSKKSCLPKDLFCIGPACNEVVFPNITYTEFVARKHQCDQERITNKEEFYSILWPLWYSPVQTYILYQEISWLTHDRSSSTIYTLTPEYFLFLIQLAEIYKISPEDALQQRLISKKWPQRVVEPKPFPPHRATKSFYRESPQPQKTRYGKTTIEVMRYDRKTAAQQLEEWWYSFRSTNLQDEETGQELTPWSTSVEWITQDLLDWLRTLSDLIKQKKWAQTNLIINWWAEWIGHWMWDNITGWKFNPNLSLLAKHAKAHGAWYTVDIRLSTEDALYLKTFFPGKSGKKQYGNSIFLYDYHGATSSLHLHMNIFSKDTYTKLFSK